MGRVSAAMLATASPFRASLWLLIGAALTVAAPAQALVTTPVGGQPGSVDLNLRATFERGEIEPNDNELSWQDARWELYTAGAGYTVGKVGPLQDLFVRFEYTWYTSPAEDVATPTCAGRQLANGLCRIHPRDRGSLLTPQVGFNLVHQRDYSLGLFFQMNIPIQVNDTKFAIPRLDFFGGGFAAGVRFQPWLYYESRVFVGSGPLGGNQNPTLALINNFGFEAQEWLLPNKIGVKVGPYFDADLRDRFDRTYDDSFYAGVPIDGRGPVTDPSQDRDRIRMMRFGYSITPYLALTKQVALEGNFTQKLFGYDTPATQFFSAGARVAF